MRTIIQHVWAEIEHDLGYKSGVAVPKEIKRKFFRLAALLETADDEFAAIKDTLAGHEAKVEQELSEDADRVGIDPTSVRQIVFSDSLLRDCDAAIAASANRQLLDVSDQSFYVGMAGWLTSAGIRTVGALRTIVATNRDAIIKAATQRIKPSHERIGRGITILYACYSVLARSGDVELFINFYHDNGFGSQDKSLRETAMGMIAALGKTPRG